MLANRHLLLFTPLNKRLFNGLFTKASPLYPSFYAVFSFHGNCWADAKIPSAELEWLQADIRQSSHKSIVCVHQCLDLIPPFGVKNGPEVRKLLQESGKVLTVLQGHYHWGNYQEIGDLHYCTMSAVVEGSGPENNAYAMLDILPGDAVRITGFRKQKSYG